LQVKDFDYVLPPERIAQFPLSERDASKLLIYRDGKIEQDVFSGIYKHLPSDSLLVFNDTKVIRARILFYKTTGAVIEIFCLEPLAPVTEVETAFHIKTRSTWKCLVGNAKRWKSGSLQLEIGGSNALCTLFAEKKENLEDGSYAIDFHWNPPEKSFSEILELAGTVPLPPYIHRPTEPSDQIRYQTIYARHEGSVAAPTAGLHFTDRVFTNLTQNGCEFAKVTLHVGVGTFRPLTAPTIQDHLMHREKIVVSQNTLKQLLNRHDRPVIAVGTTAARTLESIYWLGVKLIRGEAISPLIVNQWDPYGSAPSTINAREALSALLMYLEKQQIESLHAETQLMIVPGYSYRLLSGLITNFHMPQSTLLLLVAALIGPGWKEVYQYALSHDFRFLSYGDSCLFFQSSK